MSSDDISKQPTELQHNLRGAILYIHSPSVTRDPSPQLELSQALLLNHWPHFVLAYRWHALWAEVYSWDWFPLWVHVERLSAQFEPDIFTLSSFRRKYNFLSHCIHTCSDSNFLHQAESFGLLLPCVQFGPAPFLKTQLTWQRPFFLATWIRSYSAYYAAMPYSDIMHCKSMWQNSEFPSASYLERFALGSLSIVLFAYLVQPPAMHVGFGQNNRFSLSTASRNHP